MNVENLNRYQKLDGEIELLNEEIAELSNNHTMDVVKSSDSEFPFTEHSQKICGNNDSTLNKIVKKQKEKAEIEALKTEIEQFINAISDNTIRKIFKYRYIKGYSWAEVAKAVKGNNTRDSVRKVAKRFLEKNLQKN